MGVRRLSLAQARLGALLFVGLTAGPGALALVLGHGLELDARASQIFRPLLAFLPVLVGALLASAEDAERGVGELWRSLRNWRQPWFLWASATLLYPAIALLVCGLRAASGGPPLEARVAVSPGFLLGFLALSFVVPGLSEETGWRAYLQPRLARVLHPVLASLVVGATWAVWHAHDVLMQPERFAQSSYAYKALWLVSASVVMGYVQLASGSLLLAIVGHQSALLTFGLFPLDADSAGDWTSYEWVALLTAAVALPYAWLCARLPREPRYQTAAGLLLRDGRILLERRPEDSRVYPGLWDTPGGHLEAGESARTACERELLEELGVRVRAARLVCVQDERDAHSGRDYRHHVFAVESWEGEVRSLEGRELAWVELDELERMRPMHPLVQRAIAGWKSSGVGAQSPEREPDSVGE